MARLRRHRVFGPLTYTTLVLALLILVGFHAHQSWPAWRQYLDLRSFAGELANPDPLVRRQAAGGLVRAGEPGVQWLSAALNDRDAEIRLLAISALGRTRYLPSSAIPALTAGLHNKDARVRRLCADALGRFPAEPNTVREGLTMALTDTDPEVRFRAARALKRVGDRSNVRALGTLLALITDPDPDHFPDRALAAEVLRGMDPRSEMKAIDGLIPLVAAKAIPLRRAAIESLELLASRGRPAVLALERALADEDLVTMCLAGLALSEIEGWQKERARSVLRVLAGNESLPSRIRARARWILESNLVAGSEISQPVHTLRAIADELRQTEIPAALATPQPAVDETLPVVPR